MARLGAPGRGPPRASNTSGVTWDRLGPQAGVLIPGGTGGWLARSGYAGASPSATGSWGHRDRSPIGAWTYSDAGALPLLMALAAPSAADRPLRFDRLTVLDGLSHSWVQAIVKDRRGFMWFGTQEGLDRYDGSSFRIYRKRGCRLLRRALLRRGHALRRQPRPPVGGLDLGRPGPGALRQGEGPLSVFSAHPGADPAESHRDRGGPRRPVVGGHGFGPRPLRSRVGAASSTSPTSRRVPRACRATP